MNRTTRKFTLETLAVLGETEEDELIGLVNFRRHKETRAGKILGKWNRHTKSKFLGILGEMRDEQLLVPEAKQIGNMNDGFAVRVYYTITTKGFSQVAPEGRLEVPSSLMGQAISKSTDVEVIADGHIDPEGLRKAFQQIFETQGNDAGIDNVEVGKNGLTSVTIGRRW